MNAKVTALELAFLVLQQLLDDLKEEEADLEERVEGIFGLYHLV